jgi:hypothetical protein
MAVQDQRAARWRAGPPGADHIPGIVVILAVRRVARQVLEIVDLDLPAIDAELIFLEQAAIMSCAGASRNRVDGILTRSASTLVWSSNWRSTCS